MFKGLENVGSMGGIMFKVIQFIRRKKITTSLYKNSVFRNFCCKWQGTSRLYIPLWKWEY